jgi:hypothetical protein
VRDTICNYITAIEKKEGEQKKQKTTSQPGNKGKKTAKKDLYEGVALIFLVSFFGSEIDLL